MPLPRKLEKAQFRQIDWKDKDPKPVPGNAENTVEVQFNPETLTITYSNQKAGGDQKGGSAMQFVGQGTTKLTLEIWFDVTVLQKKGDAEPVKDVRKLTQKLNFFIKQDPKVVKDKKFKAPGVQFLWGSFLFNGVMDSLTEKLEYFSEDGKPLRAMLSISLSNQEIEFEFNPDAKDGETAGTRPFQSANQGSSMADQAAAAGNGKDWKDMAGANGIENPRDLAGGTLIDAGLGFSAGAGAGIGLGMDASFGASAGFGASVGFGASASLGASGGAGITAGAGFPAGVGLSTGIPGGVSGGTSAGSSARIGLGAASLSTSGTSNLFRVQVEEKQVLIFP